MSARRAMSLSLELWVWSFLQTINVPGKLTRDKHSSLSLPKHKLQRKKSFMPFKPGINVIKHFYLFFTDTMATVFIPRLFSG
jgi:hypothetical protein